MSDTRRWWWEFNPRNMNHPYLSSSWLDEREFYVGLAWGNGNSDPVWAIERRFRLPERLGRVVDRWYACRAKPSP